MQTQVQVKQPEISVWPDRRLAIVLLLAFLLAVLLHSRGDNLFSGTGRQQRSQPTETL